MNNEQPEELFPRRHSIRLPDYDYARWGAYFVTICCYEKQSLFGTVADSSMKLNQFGEIATSRWKDISVHYPEVNKDVFVVMPNHVHGIVIIDDSTGRAGLKPAPTIKHPLSEIVRAFKTFSSRAVNELRNSAGAPVWQRGYFEHVIRGERDHSQIGEYILFNPQKWALDKENPDNRYNLPG